MKDNRRDFIKKSATMAAAISVVGLSGCSESSGSSEKNKEVKFPVIDEYDPKNIKLSTRLNALTITDDDMLFLKQIGIRWARIQYGSGEVTFNDLQTIQQRFARYGIKIYSGVHSAYRSLKIQLGLPGRDEDIETYQTFLRNLGLLEIQVASYDFHPANTYTTAMIELNGRKTREFDVTVFRTKVEKQLFEKVYTADEIWANYTYFMKAVLPVAEEANVKLALHPDDPPLSMMNGVAKLFTDYEGYLRAEQIAGNSKHWGLTFCVGTWAEGGSNMGKDVFEMIHDFGSREKIFEVHFRNVSSPLPRFVETFPDEGYMDMYEVMKALRQVRFSGICVPDHPQNLTGEHGIYRASTAYEIAYMRTLLRRANKEVG